MAAGWEGTGWGHRGGRGWLRMRREGLVGGGHEKLGYPFPTPTPSTWNKEQRVPPHLLAVALSPLSPPAPWGPWVRSSLGTSHRLPAQHPASPHTCFSPSTSRSWLLRPGQHLSRFLTGRHRPRRAQRAGGLRGGASCPHPLRCVCTKAAAAERLRALWGRRDAGQEGCSPRRRQEPQEASGSLRPAPPCQPGPGEGGRVVAAGGGGGRGGGGGGGEAEGPGGVVGGEGC